MEMVFRHIMNGSGIEVARWHLISLPFLSLDAEPDNSNDHDTSNGRPDANSGLASGSHLI